MTQTTQPKQLKYKPGDLVKHRDEELTGSSFFSLGIIIGPKQSLWGPAYWVYWTKAGLCWHYDNENFLENLQKVETK